ncbi:Dihydroneopterin aldolase-domain-containing protein [Neohortaea acidophila]|uniref:dihydroneopterin aldolase n=1 Tax=Neohortaea acidophila TaxID=245834 RepID=A0A6A6PQ76_9PEZI|nr:Dihydroneopterin aldolase-domain-containing protein [Neohortaea acidophila]KAF2481387.1 Dihydroneopterin aldolase-domain-containing protein [Neohortaea acidophila]
MDGFTYDDRIQLINLQLPHDVIAPNIWGELKAQPALVSLKLGLMQGIESTASNDALDQNTVHYGELAKRIRGGCTAGQGLDALFALCERQVFQIARREDASSRIRDIEITVTFPKASLYGEGVELVHSITCDGQGARKTHFYTWRIKEMKVMTLIGVNAYERRAKQPLVVHLQFVPSAEPKLADRTYLQQLFGVEQSFAQLIEDSSFETLESLAEWVVKQLADRLSAQNIPCEVIRLKLDKPRAIAFADHPSVEITRMLGNRQR